MKFIVAGGTGFIGTSLVGEALLAGNTVVVLSRHPGSVKQSHPGLIVEQWDGKNRAAWARHLETADAVVNLTGELLSAKRWTKKQKGLILSSRIDSTKVLVQAIGASSRKPSVLINASGTGFYGDVPSGEVTESFPAGNDFLAQVCHRWEQEASAVHAHEVRVVTLRFGIVLAKGGGALQKMMLPFRFFAGGYLGSGNQWLPWIHRDDVIQGILFLLMNSTISGPVNFAAPESVTMKEFCKKLGKAMQSPSWTAIPPFALRLMLGEMADILLTGQRVVSKKLIDAGFVFKFPALQQALESILK